MKKRATLIFVGTALLTLPGLGALAEVDGFELQKIEGVGNLSLSNRFGTTKDAPEHFVNIEDCLDYAGGKAEFSVRLDLPTSGFSYSVGYTVPGGTCEDDDISMTATTSCIVVDSDLDVSDPMTFVVDLDTLIGSEGGTECRSGTEQTSKVYVIIENNQKVVTSEVINVDIDLAAPIAPAMAEILPGDERLVVKLDDEANDGDEVTYNVYWDDVDFTEDALETVHKKTGASHTTIELEDNIENGVTYFVRAAALDEAENMSDLSAAYEASPEETLDFWESYQAAGGTDPGGFCFIATAAYGSPMAGDLGVLRRFRDDVLMPSSVGRAFVARYYRWGRFPAAWIAGSPSARAGTRVALVPLVWFARLATNLPPVALLALILSLLMMGLAIRRALANHILRDVGVGGPPPYDPLSREVRA